MATSTDARLATATARDGADTRYQGLNPETAAAGTGEAPSVGAAHARDEQTAAWWFDWDATGEWLEWDYGFVERSVKFNGKRSVTFTASSIQTRAPTKACSRLNNKRMEITLPNGTKTWFVLWDNIHEHVKTPQDAEKRALGSSSAVIRGKTPRDKWVNVVCPVRTLENGTELEVTRVFLWGGCVPFSERTLELIKIPKWGEDVSTKSAEVRNWVERRTNLCREITEAAFHPDRVERMEAVYGDEWDDSFHTHVGVGTGDHTAWKKRQREREERAEQARRKRWDAIPWTSD